MNMRFYLAKHLVQMFGNKNVSRLQSWLKFVLTFRNDYCGTKMLKNAIGGVNELSL